MLEHEGPAGVREDQTDPVCTGEHGRKVILAIFAAGLQYGLLAEVTVEDIGPYLNPSVYDPALEFPLRWD